MKIILGTGIGTAHLRGRNVFNELACSPAVFLEVLEQRLGLTGKRPSHGFRIAGYRNALARHLQSGDAFYRDSFERDSYAVAETLLSWRDTLILDGWDVDGVGFDSHRLAGLRHVESHLDPEYRCSEGERIRRVIEQSANSSPGIEDLRVVDPEDWFPSMWRTLLKQFDPKFDAPTIKYDINMDLGRFQKALIENEATFEFKGDGSIEFVTAYSEAVLANAAAQRISGSGESAAIVDGANLHLVDAALKRLGAPSIGAATQSRSRPVPQILNIVLQLQWLPFDPQRLLDFLIHPESPVDGILRSRLADAVIEEPGIGGEAWNRAIETARSFYEKRYSDDTDRMSKALKRIDADLNDWLSPPDLDPNGADSRQLGEIALRLGQWANRRAQTSNDKALLFHSLHAMALEFASIIQEKPSITRAEAERLLRQLTGSGLATADSPSELGHLPVWTAAGFVEPVETVIWWDFTEPAAMPLHPWTPDELAELRKSGIQPASAEELARQSAERQLRPVLAAHQKLILFKAAQRGGEELPEHPLWTRLQTAVKQAEAEPNVIDTDTALSRQQGGKALELTRLRGQALPQLRRWLQLPQGTSIPQRERESFSSLKKFVYSPFEWVCEYTARLSTGNLANSRLAVDPRLMGQLVHRLVELMFPAAGPTFAWQESSEEQLEEWINDQWTNLLEQEGALLLLPGHRSEASTLRVLARRTLVNLIGMLRRHDARNVIADHTPAPQAFGEGVLRGDIDLCYETGDGEQVVVDLKFGGYDDRAAEVQNNTALQLAVYGYLMRQGNLDNPPKSAFYILTKRAWITGDGGFFDVRPVDPGDAGPPDMSACWSAFQQVWEWRREQINAGHIEVTFTGTEHDDQLTPPHAAWGRIENEGKYSDLVKLAGWKEGA